jgi:hypothetical protein
MRLKRQQILSVAAIFAFYRGAAAQGQGIDFSKIEIITEKLGPNLDMLSGSAIPPTRTRPAAGLACWPVRRVFSWSIPSTRSSPQSDGRDPQNQPRADPFSCQYAPPS